jgi:type III secretory pathway lipoprotein EscJ
VRRLVAGSIANLQPDAVTVVMVGRPAGSELPALALAHIGPIAVTRSSLLWVQLFVLASSLGLISLLAFIVHQRSRLNKLRTSLDQEARA